MSANSVSVDEVSLRKDMRNPVRKIVEETLNAPLDEEASELVGAERCPRAAAVLEEAEPDALAHLDFPPSHWKRLRANNAQERTSREIKRRSRVAQVFPSTGSLMRLAGAVMRGQDEIWQESRHFSEMRMNELYDDGRTRGIDGPVEWARLEAEARKMLESGLELADRVEAA